MSTFYLAYGMNTNLRQMSTQCPDAVCLGKVDIKDYRLNFRYHADIEPAAGETMQAVLWKITDRCEQALDFIEGYPYYYEKESTVVELTKPYNGMTRVIAMFYTMTKKGPLRPPSDAYQHAVTEGYTTHGLDLNLLDIAIKRSMEASVEL